MSSIGRSISAMIDAGANIHLTRYKGYDKYTKYLKVVKDARIIWL